MEFCYRGQFVKSAEPEFHDGRDRALTHVKKILRGGPHRPGSLAKRERPSGETANAIRKMLMTDEDRRLNSNADDALSAIKKALALPSQSFNADDISAPARRSGATGSLDGYRDGPSDNARPTKVPPPHSASVSSGRVPPQDDDAEDSDATTKALRAIHRAGPRKEYLR